jgi:hypothetical protein
MLTQGVNMPSTITVVDESKTLGTKLPAITQALNIFSKQVTTAWGLPPQPVVMGSARGNGTWNVCFVPQFPNPSLANVAYGYHELDSNNNPIAYIRVNAYGSRNPYGTYIKPLTILGKQITKAFYTPGIAAVAMHELAEMLVDPQINAYKLAPDGKQWLCEICDHTVGNYLISPDGYNANIIAPDFTWPAFYNVNSPAPYSQMNVPTKPFTLVRGAYGYYKNGNSYTPLTATSELLDKE